MDVISLGWLRAHVFDFDPQDGYVLLASAERQIDMGSCRQIYEIIHKACHDILGRSDLDLDPEMGHCSEIETDRSDRTRLREAQLDHQWVRALAPEQRLLVPVEEIGSSAHILRRVAHADHLLIELG